MTRRPYRATHGMTSTLEQMPGWERQAIEIIDCRTRDDSGRNVSSCDSHCGVFGFAADQEVSVTFQQFRHVCCRRSKKSHPHVWILALRLLRPIQFVPVIDERTQRKSHVAFNHFICRDADLVSCIFENGGQIAGMNTLNILKKFADTFEPSRRERETAKS